MNLLAQSGGITDPSLIVQPHSLSLQPVGAAFMDPVFGTSIRRVSDTSENGGFETQIYNQLQPFSSDNVYLLLVSRNGYRVRRVDNLSLVENLETGSWNTPRWHPLRPHTIVHFDSNDDTTLRLQFTDVDSLTTTTVYTFPSQYERILVNQSFDEISENGHWLAGMASRNDGESVIFSLNIEDFRLGIQMAVADLYAGPCEPDPDWGRVEPDWVGVSPLGNYIVVQWVRDGISPCSGLETLNILTGEFTGRVTDHHNHGDLGVDVDGTTEYFMTSELSSPDDPNRPAIAMRLLPGLPTVSPPVFLRTMDWSDEDHVSCQGPHGVGLYSWGSYSGVYDFPFKNELFLQYTDGSVRRLIHHRSSKCGYWVQPRASLSRDGRYVVFASDWGEETGVGSCDTWSDPLGRGDPYIIDLQATNTRVENSSIVDNRSKSIDLGQNYPNPFNPSTRIIYTLPEATHVHLKIFNARGQEIITLVNKFQSAGHKSVLWEGTDENGLKMASGVYYYLLRGEPFQKLKKMLLIQ